MTTTIVFIFLLGYLCIALESVTRVNKTAVALLMCVACWTVYNVSGGAADSSDVFARLLGETCEIIFFLMGAMTIVEVVDTYGGFNFVRERLLTRRKRALFWRIILITFFLSSVLDNLTTAIVMIMVLRKLDSDKTERMLLSCMVILAANGGGAFSPIGDVTTIMLWVKGNISTMGVLQGLFLPSLASVVVPGLLLQRYFSGTLDTRPLGDADYQSQTAVATRKERYLVFFLGVGGLISVPVFRMLTGLPPFMGILLVLGLLWMVTELIFRRERYRYQDAVSLQMRVSSLLHKIDLSTILFFLGILMAVSAVAETGVLRDLGVWLDNVSGGNPYIVTGVIGLFSSIVDNVPLVAACMNMYDLVPSGAQVMAEQANYVCDGAFWELLAYCAGVGGSLLIVGSAAGVVVMGLEKISFGWYMKRFSLLALVGYVSGMLLYAALKMLA